MTYERNQEPARIAGDSIFCLIRVERGNVEHAKMKKPQLPFGEFMKVWW